jgi:hypothetical protein
MGTRAELICIPFMCKLEIVKVLCAHHVLHFQLSLCLSVSLVERDVLRLWTFSDSCKDQILLAQANVSGAQMEWGEQNILCINCRLQERLEQTRTVFMA